MSARKANGNGAAKVAPKPSTKPKASKNAPAKAPPALRKHTPARTLPNLFEPKMRERTRAAFEGYPLWPVPIGGTEEDEDRFAEAEILMRFCESVLEKKTLDSEIQQRIALQILAVLRGAAWDDVMKLPGRDDPPGRMHPRDQRDLGFYLEARRFVKAGRTLTKAFEEIATKANLSEQSVRAGYYAWKDRFADPDF